VKRLALIQSAYVPWKGFFDLVDRCDELVIYDTAGYSKGHWHNRNRIKTANGTKWLTIPVKSSGRLGQPINTVEVQLGWAASHLAAIRQAYGRSPHAAEIMPIIEKLYCEIGPELSLSKVNEIMLRALCDRLRIGTSIVHDTLYASSGVRTDRIVSICRAASATHYLSGPSAKAYIEPQKFMAADIQLEWMQYGPYEPYEQQHGSFEHTVSILDALFSLGLKDWRKAIAIAVPANESGS
jgi:WbqC-like protein family